VSLVLYLGLYIYLWRISSLTGSGRAMWVITLLHSDPASWQCTSYYRLRNPGVSRHNHFGPICYVLISVAHRYSGSALHVFQSAVSNCVAIFSYKCMSPTPRHHSTHCTAQRLFQTSSLQSAYRCCCGINVRRSPGESYLVSHPVAIVILTPFHLAGQIWSYAVWHCTQSARVLWPGLAFPCFVESPLI